MNIAHLALWTPRLEFLRDFYVRNFAAEPDPIYQSPTRPFRSCFVRFATGARLELMEIPGLQPPSGGRATAQTGLAHYALAVGSEARVREFTTALRAAGVPVVADPRRTGDGFFESVVLDPDGNRIEITV